MRRLFFAWACLASLGLQAQSIESLLSVPFPSSMIASKDGKTLAWVFNNQGVRNVFRADAPSFATKQITHFKEDDGVDIANLAVTPNGDKIIFEKGNDANGRGENANPARLQVTTERTLFLASKSADTLQKIAPGFAPVISPDGKRLVFFYNDQLWITSLDSLAPHKLFQVRGTQVGARWSPDGSQLAFVNSRGDHSFIGFYDFASKKISFPDPSTDIDSDPEWSPDGKSIAFIRRYGYTERIPFVSLRSGEPWSIRILNLEKNEATEIWKADTGRGSVLHQGFPVMENFLLWTAGNQLVFPWEKDGWQHLYALNLQTRKVQLLTPGNGEVENVILSSNKKKIYYTSNISDIDHRHISSIDVERNSQQALTRGNGLEWSPVELEGNRIAVFHSSFNRPAWPALLESEGNLKDVATEFFPSGFAQNFFTMPQVIEVTATDGMKTPAQLFLPKDYKPGVKYPALLFFHGGSQRQMLPAFHYMDYYSHTYALNQYFASKGFIVLSVNYRSGIGYGLDFREALNYGANGASEVNDVIGAGLYIKSRADVDSRRIALWGGSYGGYLTAFGLAKASDLFACGVDIHGVHNWNKEIKNWVSDYDPARNEIFAKRALESSPVHFIQGWRSPVLLIHGDDDRNVPFNESVDIAAKLRMQHVEVEQLVFPDEVHDILLHGNLLKAYHACFEFINRRLEK